MKKLESSQQGKLQKQKKENIVVNYIHDDTDYEMKDEYDFSKMQARPNPYAGHLKKQITIRIESGTIDYFKKIGNDLGVPYQTLMNMCLSDYAKNKRVPKIEF